MFYFPLPFESLKLGKPKEKADRNIQCIKLAEKILGENRLPNYEEKNLLSLYTGWGDMSVYKHAKEELATLLSEEELNKLKESTLNAHYTDLKIVYAIMKGVAHLFDDNIEIKALDPSAGIGHFHSCTPHKMRNRIKWTEIELDETTGKILSCLHPQALICGFEDYKCNEGEFDLVVSNVPFGNYPVFDPDMKENFLKSSIHNYFLAKSIRATAPGGLIAIITSRYTMDSKSSQVREWVSQRADLLTAIRLPQDTFKENAGTQVVTDVLFFRKRHELLAEDFHPEWIDTASLRIYKQEEGAVEVSYNKYFHVHPNNVLGRIDVHHGMYSNNELTVTPRNLVNTAEALENLLMKELEESSLVPIRNETKEIPAVELSPISASSKKPSAKTEKMVAEALVVYEIARKLLDSDTKNSEDANTLRDNLNEAYDNFVAAYGKFSSKKVRSSLGESLGYYFLSSLEEGKSNEKAPLFHHSTVKKNRLLRQNVKAKDALLISLDNIGKIDLGFMMEATGLSKEKLFSQIQELVFVDPKTGEYLLSEDYLSGDILAKLEQAREKAAENEDFDRNVEALEAVLPEPLKASEIKATIGAGWIPLDVTEDFLRELLGESLTIKELGYSESLGLWTVKLDVRYVPDAFIFGKYGTERMSATKLIEKALNGKTPIVFNRLHDGTQKLNRSATIAAQAKYEEIIAKFDMWVWEDQYRAERLTKIYNEKFNTFVPKKFDGKHLTFPGMSNEITLRPHQKDFVWRTVKATKAAAIHDVGMGKTYTAIAAMMEAKRLNLANKAMVVVPNHLVGQWGESILKVYPSAKVLVINKSDRGQQGRTRFLARIATGDWDIVVTSTSAFKLMPAGKKVLNDFLVGEMQKLRDYLERNKGDVGRGATKSIQRQIKRYRAKLYRKSDMKKDSDMITWDMLGIDMLVVDEFHTYKNLFFATKKSRVAGLSNSSSQTAFDMFAKSRYLLKNGGRFVGLTATPITNSLAEAFTLQRFFDYEYLEKAGLAHFDAWAKMFAQEVTQPEITPEGGGFRMNTRLSNFTNVAELSTMLGRFCDVVKWDSVSSNIINRPALHKGSSLIVGLQKSDALSEYIKSLSERALKIKNGGVDPREDNMLKITGDGRRAAADIRLVLENSKDYPFSKLHEAAYIISKIYAATMSSKATQLVFLDIGTPTGKGLNLYLAMKENLIELGVSQKDIAFIHDATSQIKRNALFDDVKNGNIRILIGSTQKMGTGMNVQDRLIALHHIDAPWRPADVEQREGRMLRQGNMFKKVFEFLYVVKGSFDGYIWQTLETKAKFISQIMSGRAKMRKLEDISSTALSMSEVKALASGNPDIMKLVAAESRVAQLNSLRSSWLDSRRQMSFRVKDYKRILKNQKLMLSNYKALIAHSNMNKSEDFKMVVMGKEYTERKAAGAALNIAMMQYGKYDATIGEYNGFSIKAVYRGTATKAIYAKFILSTPKIEDTIECNLGASARGTIQSISANIRALGGLALNAEKNIEITQKEIASIAGDNGGAWAYQDEYTRLKGDIVYLRKKTMIEKDKAANDTGDTVERDTFINDEKSERVLELVNGSLELTELLDAVYEAQKEIGFTNNKAQVVEVAEKAKPVKAEPVEDKQASFNAWLNAHKNALAPRKKKKAKANGNQLPLFA